MVDCAYVLGEMVVGILNRPAGKDGIPGRDLFVDPYISLIIVLGLNPGEGIVIDSTGAGRGGVRVDHFCRDRIPAVRRNDVVGERSTKKRPGFRGIGHGGQGIINKRAGKQLPKVALPHAHGRDIAPLEYLDAVAGTFVVHEEEGLIFAMIDMSG